MSAARWRPHSLLAAVVTVAAGCSQGPLASVERLDVRVAVAESGVVDVSETAVVSFAPAGSRFERQVDGAWADAIAFLEVIVDGRPAQASGDLQFEAVDGRALHVRLTSPVAQQAPREVQLRYRLIGAVGLDGPSGVLTVPILGDREHAGIGTGTVVLALPAGAPVLEGTGLAEAGWQIAREPRGLLATRGSIGPSETVTLMARFPVTPGTRAEPQWQRHRLQARFFAPAFVSAGVFILVVGAGVLWMVRMQYPRGPRTPSSERDRAEARRGFRLAGAAALGLSGLTAVAARYLLDHLGPWPLALPVSIFIVGTVFLGVSRRWV